MGNPLPPPTESEELTQAKAQIENTEKENNASNGNNGNDGNGTPGGQGNSGFDPNDPNYVKQQLENARANAGGRGGSTNVVDENGNPLGAGNYTSGPQIQDPQLGPVRCAEGFACIGLENTGTTPPPGDTVYMYTYQLRGLPPCDGFCQDDLDLFARLKGIRIRVYYGIDKAGNINAGYQDFPKPTP
jgi:hypothetical protein